MNILLAIDGLEHSDAAALFLSRLNYTSDDRIIILHVASEKPHEDEYHATVKKVIKRLAPEILSSAADMLKDVKAKVTVEEKKGHPEAAIVESAVGSDVDLIVMGARGVKGIKLFLLGSVARHVAAVSPKPVLVVKLTEWETPRKMRILFAADGSESAVETAKLLAAMPFYDDFEITILNVHWSTYYDVPERFAMEVDDRIKETIAEQKKADLEKSEKMLDEAKAHLSGKYKHLQTLIKFGDPSSEILSAARQSQADIIAIGCRGLKGLSGVMGSVSRNIVMHAKSSVLIGKAP